jgi:type VI secretion system protein ImpH
VASAATPDALDAALPRLLREPCGFDFHQAVRLAAHWLASQPAPARAELRFRNSLSLCFPASELLALETEARDDGGACAGTTADPAALRRITLTPAFMGLLGSNGALPLAYSEQLAAHEARHRDAAARGFLDVFQHRAVSLFHDAWRKHRLALQAESAGLGDRTLSLVLSLAGLGAGGRAQAAPDGVADAALAHYAGLLQRRGAGASALQRMLADYLGVPVRIAQFVGRWCVLQPESQSLLGGANAVLGRAAVLGERVWQRDLRLRVVLGPLDAARQQRFLPRQPGARALRELLALAGGASLEWEVRLHLRAEAVAQARLGATADGAGTRLGWSGFLLAQPSPVAREETVYELHTQAA